MIAEFQRDIDAIDVLASCVGTDVDEARKGRIVLRSTPPNQRGRWCAEIYRATERSRDLWPRVAIAYDLDRDDAIKRACQFAHSVTTARAREDERILDACDAAAAREQGAAVPTVEARNASLVERVLAEAV